MHDLKDKLTFLIAAKVDHEDRLRNIRTTLSYLRHHFNANIIISEQDTSSKLHDMCKAFKCRQKKQLLLLLLTMMPIFY